MEINTKINRPFSVVKKAFVDKEGLLLRRLIPSGCELLHYKGLRRGAIIKIMVLNEVVTFKIATYSTAKDKLYFNDILHRGKFLGIKLYFNDFIAKLCAFSGSKLNIKGLKKENIKIIFSTFFPLNQLSL